ncbi:MAG: holo-ACP synthase [Candidatus Zixiibacteriota bacterium]
MIYSVGLDIVDITRVNRDIRRFGNRFVERILGEMEIPIFNARVDKEAFLAGRWSAKEAVIKGLAPFLDKRPQFRVLQVVNDSTGQPKLILPPNIQKKLGKARCLLSLTHEKTYAAAVAIFVEEQ